MVRQVIGILWCAWGTTTAVWKPNECSTLNHLTGSTNSCGNDPPGELTPELPSQRRRIERLP